MLGAAKPVSNTDLDNLGNGIFYAKTNNTHAPSGYCYVISTTESGNDCGQFAWNVNGAWRRRKSSNTWSEWVRVYDEGILTDSSILSPLASALGGASPQIIEIAVGGQETVTVSGTAGFILARENFYNSNGALWYFHGGTCKVVYEEDQTTLSATNASARVYVSTGSSSGSSTITIKNNHNGSAKLQYKIIVM